MLTTKRLFAFLLLNMAALGAIAQERLLSIGGDVTEIIYALDAQHNLVGRDSTSIHPKEAKNLPDVGYMRQLNAEGILALKPTRVITTQVAKPAVVFEQLSTTGVKVETVPFDYTAKSVAEKIILIGKYLDKQPEAVKLAEKFTKEVEAINNSPLNVKILFLFNHAGSNQMAAGKNTVADTAINMIGASNAISSVARFSPISQEGVIAANPDLIVLTNISLETLGSLDKLWELPGIALTNAGKNKKAVVVDDLAFLSFGLTTPQELQKMRQAAEQISSIK